MKKQIIHLFMFTSLAVLPAALTTGCAVMRHQESASEYGRDTEITAKIKANLYKDPLVKGTQVNVTTMKGIVQLSGFVDSEAARDRAGQIARTVKGVVDVHNDILTPTGR